MNIVNLLEKLATHTRFQTEYRELLSSQSSEMGDLFLKNDSSSLKMMLENTHIIADRTTIFKL